MIEKISMKNFGPIKDLEWDELGKINLINGRNAMGKTFLLKSMYATIRSIEMYKRGDSVDTLGEILRRKLHWTFQTDKIGDLVSKKADDELSFSMNCSGHNMAYHFGQDTKNKIFVNDPQIPRNSNSLFLPAKEIVSFEKIIIESRDNDMVFGFDDTYYDLAKATSYPLKKGKNFTGFSKARGELEVLADGKLVFDINNHRWIFKKKDRSQYPVFVTAEGIKKIAILDTLLGNHYLNDKSIVFIDEPEAALHPSALRKFLTIIAILAKSGIQFFLASHSYFTVKQLYLIARREKLSIPILSMDREGYRIDDLQGGIPPNEIIQESIDLYKEEIDLD